MKAYITKYALTDGIKEVEDARQFNNSGMIHVASIHSQAYFFNEGNEWHKTLESAIEKSENMRIKKIASLKKQIAKLENLKFK